LIHCSVHALAQCPILLDTLAMFISAVVKNNQTLTTSVLERQIPSNWIENKDFKRIGRLDTGDLVMVQRSDGSTRFGEVARKVGFFYQDQWEVVVTLSPAGKAGSARVEEGVMLGRPSAAAIADLVGGLKVVQGGSAKPPPPVPSSEAPKAAPVPPPPKAQEVVAKVEAPPPPVIEKPKAAPPAPPAAAPAAPAFGGFGNFLTVSSR
jgi:hypothetical protein